MSRDPRAHFVVDTTTGKDMKKGFTLSILCSKQFCIKHFFKAFGKLRIPLDYCHLLIIDNTDKSPLGEMLKEIALDLKDRFYTVRLYKTFRQGARSTRHTQFAKFQETKLPYIYAAYKDIIKFVTTKTFINLEDDTVPPPHTIMYLLKDQEKHGEDTFISGILSDRGDDLIYQTRLGVHYIHRVDGMMLQRVSLSPKCKGVKEVDAAGWFCFITSKKVWKEGLKGMSEYLNEIPHFALDMFHTNNMKQKGYKVYADFRVHCFHIHPTPTKTLFWKPSQAISMIDYYIPQYKVWAQAVPLKEDIKERPDFDRWVIPEKSCPVCKTH